MAKKPVAQDQTATQRIDAEVALVTRDVDAARNALAEVSSKLNDDPTNDALLAEEEALEDEVAELERKAKRIARRRDAAKAVDSAAARKAAIAVLQADKEKFAKALAEDAKLAAAVREAESVADFAREKRKQHVEATHKLGWDLLRRASPSLAIATRRAGNLSVIGAGSRYPSGALQVVEKSIKEFTEANAPTVPTIEDRFVKGGRAKKGFADATQEETNS